MALDFCISKRREGRNMSLSECCNTEMVVTMELGRFVEMKCAKCGDLVYLKQYSKNYRNHNNSFL